MPLPMQGDELLPGQQNIGGSGIWPGAPDRRSGDGALDSLEQIAETALGQFGRERRSLLRSRGIGIVDRVFCEIFGEMMGENVDQRAFELLPVVGSGYSWLQAFAPLAGAANVRAGRTTFVGIGRGALSQPDFGRRLIEGEALEPKRLCRTFSYCTALMRAKHNELGQFATGCPPFDKEVYGPIWDEARKNI